MRVKRFAQILLAVQAVMVVLLGVSTYLLEHRLELLNRSREVAFQSYLLADELRQSFDDLTRLARSFVAAGDPEFEREYREVLDIRNGKLPRPTEYHRIYWDLVTAANPRPRPAGRAVPLRQLMIDEGFTPVELRKLDEAQRQSDGLVRTETIAMNAAKGLFDDGAGHWTRRAPDRDLSIRLMHDDAYHEAKRRIMQPIDEFYALFEARTAGAVAEAQARAGAQLRWLSVLLAATLALFVGSFAALLRQSAEREAAQAAQRQSEEMLLSAFQASPAAIWISEGEDARACVAINDAFETTTGFSREDVVGKTGDDISLYEHPGDRDVLVRELRRSGGIRDIELPFRKKSGEVRDGVFNAQISRVGGKAYVLVVLTDVTETKRARRELEQLLRVEILMADLAASFVSAPDDALDHVVQEALRRIGECFDLDMASIWQPEPGAPEHVVRTHAFLNGDSSAIETASSLDDFPWMLELGKTNKTVVLPDVRALPESARKAREQLVARGVTNLISIPWCTAPDRLDGVVYFASTQSRQLDATTVSQLETLSRTLLVVLSRARERHATAEARERMQTHLQMLDDAPAGITINGQGGFLYANKQAAVMHGYTPEELRERTVSDLVAPEEQSRIEPLRQTIREQGSHSFTIWHRRKDGTRLHVGAQVRRSTWLGQNVSISVFVDLSERERAERQLRQSEERYRLLAENVSDVISVVDLETERFEYVSPSVLRLRGYTAEEVIGQRMEATLAAESVVHARRRIAQLIEAERSGDDPAPEENDGSVVYQQIRKDGSTVPTDVRARIIRDPTSGKPLLVSVSRDVSERQKAQKEREELQQQLYQSQKIEAIGGLAGGVAHDFNNLLSVIMSYTDFVVDGLPEDDRRRSDLLEVQKASDRAAALVRQLLAFSRKQILELRVIDLNQVVGGIEKMLRRLLGEDIRLEVKLGEGLGTVLGDAGQVEQVLMNLVVNARDAMPRGGLLTIETTNVEVAANGGQPIADLKPGRYVAITVADSGSGMDEATLARVFEPFFTTKGLGKGTGLGLSTVYGIVKQSEGEVTVTSKLGVGTAITVYLPRKDEPPSAPSPELASRPIAGHETVLVVEDEDELRAVIQRILRKAGYTVLVAENGTRAVALFDEHQGKVDLLLTDVVMPEMSGREIAERLARINATLKVLYMSGYTDEIIDRHGVLEVGMRLIGKPFTAADISRKVRSVLDEEPGAPT